MSNGTKYHGIKSLARLYADKYNTTLRVGEERIQEMKVILEEGLCDKNFNGIQFIDSITLKKVIRKSKLCRNPKTKEEVTVPERPGVKAIISKNLLDKLEQ